jgi:hypothetical protein
MINLNQHSMSTPTFALPLFAEVLYSTTSSEIQYVTSNIVLPRCFVTTMRFPSSYQDYSNACKPKAWQNWLHWCSDWKFLKAAVQFPSPKLFTKSLVHISQPIRQTSSASTHEPVMTWQSVSFMINNCTTKLTLKIREVGHLIGETILDVLHKAQE